MTAIKWKSAVNGDWATGADWSAGTIPGAADDVTIDAAGTYTVTINGAEAARSLVINDAGATITDNKTLTITTTLAVDAGLFQLNSGGLISGGTLSAAGGSFQWNGGALSGVTYEGTLDLSAPNAALIITGGLTATGANGVGPGTINDTGYGSYLYAAGGEFLDNITVDIGNSGLRGTYSTFDLHNPGDATPVLTLGAQFELLQTDAYAQVQSDSNYADESIISYGGVIAGVSGGFFPILLANFTNRGVIEVSNHDFLEIAGASFTNTGFGLISVTGIGSDAIIGEGGAFTNSAMATISISGATLNVEIGLDATTWSNAGTITVGAGSTATIDGGGVGAWSNTGSITVDAGASLTLGGDFTTAQLTGIIDNGGTIAVSGTMTNTGVTLKVGSGTSMPVLGLSGTIVGGTIVDEGSGLQSNGGILSGVAYDGALNLTSGEGSLIIAGGFTLTGTGGAGPGVINATGVPGGNLSGLQVAGGETLDNITLNLGGGSLRLYNPGDASPVLTLGAHFNIVQVESLENNVSILGYGGAADEAIISNGSITAGVYGGSFSITPVNFTNNGSITVSSGDVVNLQSTHFTNLSKGVLTGGRYEVDAGSTLQFLQNVSIYADNATIILNGHLANLLTPTGGKLIAIDSTLATITAKGVLEVLGGRSWTSYHAMSNAGTLDLGGGVLEAVSLTNTGTVSGYGTVAAAFSGAGSVTSAGGALAFTGMGDVFSGALAGTEIDFVGGTQAVNAGATVGTSAWSISGGAAMSVNESLTYAGMFSEAAKSSIAVGAGDKLTLSGPSALGGALSGAGILAAANAALSGLTVGGTTVFSVTGAATQTGAMTIGDATTAAASLSIAKGATYTISGAVEIVHGLSNQSSLKVAGTLIKSGATGTSTIDLATYDTGAIEAAVGTLDFSNKLFGSGSLKIDAGATLQADASAASTLSVVFDGANAMLALRYAKNFAATIGGFAAGDTIDLIKTGATGASVNASDQLVIVKGAATIATLQLAGGYTGATFSVGSDGRGGTDVTLVAAAPQAFVAAMASLNNVGGGLAAFSSVAATTAMSTRLLSPGAHA